MKRIYFLLVILLGYGICEAQYFNSGMQAQGHVDNKNYLVDYSTGIFHYNVPLFTISTGNYNLPVSISYTGRGRKISDVPGLSGYNWDLIYGAVITRSIRSNPAYEEDQEADIYTLALNGQAYYFIKRGDSYEFLEKTNLKLKHEIDDTWIVKDENGITYIFTVKEVTRDAGQVADFSTNNVNVKEYISAWYVSEIRIPNADNIYFEYTPSYSPNMREQIDSVNMGEACNTCYLYGGGMMYYQFNYGGGITEAQSLIKSAFDLVRLSYLNRTITAYFDHVRFLNERGFIFANSTLGPDEYINFVNDIWAYDPKMERKIAGFQSKVMGVELDYSGVSSIYQDLVDIINGYIRQFRYLGYGWEYETAILKLRQAKEELMRSLCSIESYWEKSQYLFSSYVVYTPRIKQIKCREEKYFFEYSKEGEYFFLKNVRVNDIQGKLKWSLEVCTSEGNLSSLEWKGKDNQKIQDMIFTYHQKPHSWMGIGEDEWGYCSEAECYLDSICQRAGNIFYRCPVSDTSCYLGSLKMITLPEGGNLEIDYESNHCLVNGESQLFGGIRLKRLTIRNGDGLEDVIEYNYPNAGNLIYNEFYNWEEICYPSRIKDLLFRNKMKYRGNVYVKSGNNGLYYDYVEEKIVGKGMNTYLFCVPKSSGQQLANTYPFWLCGLPLAQASYDENGNLVYLQKNRYYTDMRTCRCNVSSENWFTQARAPFLYQKEISQKRISEFYLDPEKSKKEYFDKNIGGYFFVDDLDGFSVYYDIQRLYDCNVVSRFGYPKYSSEYTLYYGGKTLLERQVSYLFSESTSTASSLNHLTGEIPAGGRVYQQIDYMYDNSLLITPTRIIQTLSNEDQLITCKKTPFDFIDNIDPVIKQMIDSNLLTPVIKDMSLLKKKGNTDYVLLSEQVNTYMDTINENREVRFLPHQTFMYSAGQARISSSSFTNLDTKYYSVNGGTYRE